MASWPLRRLPHLRAWGGALSALLVGCGAAAPASRFPDAEALLEQMHQQHLCSRGIQAEAKLDVFQGSSRVRGDVLYKAMLPDQVRFDAFSPFGVMLSTLTSDGKNFALFDLREKVFWQGPATSCNLARFTRVAVPPHALVQLLRGEAPVLVHQPGAAQLSWESPWFGEGYYRVRVPSVFEAVQEIHLRPRRDDLGLPWSEQRVRVVELSVEQQGVALYRAELSEHRAATLAEPFVDPDGLTPTLPPSGPACAAEIPMRIRVEVPYSEQDLVILNRQVVHNPPVSATAFEQPIPAGVTVRQALCRD